MLPADVFEIQGKFYKGIKEGIICEGYVLDNDSSVDYNLGGLV